MCILLATLSGIITIFIFPYSSNSQVPYLGWMAWFALIPLCYAVIKSTPRRAMLWGFITAFIYYLGSLYWMYTAIHDFAKYPDWATCIMICSCVLILALFIGVACLFAKILTKRFRISIIFSLPLTWTLIDYIRNYIPSNGFPWNNLAYSQHLFLPTIQISDLTGIYGLTFLIVLTNVSTAWLINWLTNRKAISFDKMIFLAPILFLAVLIYGFYKIQLYSPPSGDKIKVAVMHGATPQELKDDAAEGRRQIAVFSDLSKQAVEIGVDLLIWPETIFVGPASVGKKLPIPIKNFGVPLILGAMTFQPDLSLSNSAILVGHDGLIEGVHSKIHLVPFGEYVPKGFFFLRKMVSNKQKIIPGKNYTLFDFKNYKTGVLICYEDAFPDIARKFSRQGAGFLTVISNDGWFEGTQASSQHLTFSVFRAVENRRYLVRSSNRGASAFISPIGQVIDSETALTELSLLSEITPIDSKTIYTKHGDWFICCLVVIALVLGLKSHLKSRGDRQNL